MNRNRQHGFTLIEVLIAVAISGILMAGITSLMTIFNNELRNSNSKLNSLGVAQEIRNSLSSSTLCASLLGGKTIAFSGMSPTSITLGGGRTIAAGAILKSEKIYVKELAFDNPLNTGAFSTANRPIFTANLIMDAAVYDGHAPGDADYKGRQFSRTVVGNFSLELASAAGPSSQIVGCQIATNIAQVCTSLGGTMSASGTCTIVPDYGVVCAGLGGVYDGTKCNFASTGGNPDPATLCASIGGAWNGTKCVLQTAAADPAATCASMGGTWDGTKCTLSGGDGGGGVCQNSALYGQQPMVANMPLFNGGNLPQTGTSPNGANIVFGETDSCGGGTKCQASCISGIWTPAQCTSWGGNLCGQGG